MITRSRPGTPATISGLPGRPYPPASPLALALPVLLGSGFLGAPVLAQDAASPFPTQGELQELLEAHDVPGVAMATLSECRLDEVVVAGFATLDPETPVTRQTAFEAASLSKAVFAWLVMTLVEEGVVGLDTPFARDMTYPRIENEEAFGVLTPRMVLTHRTGMPNWVQEQVPFFERTAAIPFLTTPGTAYTYSGEAFQLLQAHVEQRTGASLQELFRERLGTLMPNSTFALPIPEGVTPSRGYGSARDPGTGRGMSSLRARGMAASSFVTTVEDFARFVGHVCAGEGLAPETRAEMLRPQSPVPDDEAPVPTAYGLGWMVADLGGATFIGHGGSNVEYRALAGFIPETGEGFVLLTNGARGNELIDVVAAPPEPGPPPLR